MTMNYQINFFEYLRHFPLHSLVWSLGEGNWVTQDGEDWVTEDGFSWGSSGYNKHLSWIKCLVAPLQILNSDLVTLVANIRYRMNLTGQVIYLEHYLNDLFDMAERRIYIDDATPTLPVSLFNKADDLEAITLYNKADGELPLYIYNSADFDSQFDFVVMVPAAIPLTASFQDQVRAAVNQYRQAGKRFTIQNF